MISQTQTAKKGDTRKALLESAGENAEEKLDSHQLKDKESKGDTLDNPFMNTQAAAGLGVPLANERMQKIALAAQAADPNDTSSNKLMAKAAVAKREMAKHTTTIDLNQPAPSMERIVQEVTLDASSNIESPSDTVLVLDAAPQKGAPKKAVVRKTVAKKTVAKKPAAKKVAAKKLVTKKPAAPKAPSKKPRAKTATVKTAAGKTTTSKTAAKKITLKAPTKTTAKTSVAPTKEVTK
jgi:hypothetical protein